ncbi:hypothetical protein BC828DRAFT_214245 [Blastocladiella britannica]|nr:hypothetical protein BC828DRAFT_214245 [Blastocladiella britannica]
MPPATTTRPHIYLRTTAPDGLLSRATLSLTPLLPNGSCSIVAGKRSIALVPNVTGLYPPDVAAHTVGQQIADSGALVSGLLDGIHQVCLVLGLAGSGKTALLEGANPKTAAGGVLDGIVKSLYDALKLKSDNDGGGLASFTLSLSIQEHYSEIVRDLLSSKREKDIPTRINWNDCSCKRSAIQYPRPIRQD